MRIPIPSLSLGLVFTFNTIAILQNSTGVTNRRGCMLSTGTSGFLGSKTVNKGRWTKATLSKRLLTLRCLPSLEKKKCYWCRFGKGKEQVRQNKLVFIFLNFDYISSCISTAPIWMTSLSPRGVQTLSGSVTYPLVKINSSIQLKPEFDAAGVRLVAIGLERFGLEDFIEGGYCT